MVQTMWLNQEYSSPFWEILQKTFGVVGMDDPNFTTLDKALKDDKRIRYHADYLSNLQAAIW